MLQDFKKHLMTGISYMIPMVVAGGILGALAKGLGGWEVGNLAPDASGATIFSYLNAFDWGQFWWAISKLSDFAMSFACAVLAAGIAYSMSERPGIVPAFILGYTANQAKAGFIGALILGFIVGWLVNVFKKYGEKLPKALQGLLPVLIIPVFVTFIVGALFFMLLMGPMTAVMTAIQNWIMSLNGGSKFLVGAVIGACMGFDMGGPINKTASMAANALFADGYAAPESAKIIGGMTPPIGVAIAGGIAMAAGVETPAAHGGIFVCGLSTNPLMWLVAMVVGSVVTGILYAIFKKKPAEEEDHEEEVVDLDLDINIE